MALINFDINARSKRGGVADCLDVAAALCPRPCVFIPVWIYLVSCEPPRRLAQVVFEPLSSLARLWRDQSSHCPDCCGLNPAARPRCDRTGVAESEQYGFRRRMLTEIDSLLIPAKRLVVRGPEGRGVQPSEATHRACVAHSRGWFREAFCDSSQHLQQDTDSKSVAPRKIPKPNMISTVSTQDFDM